MIVRLVTLLGILAFTVVTAVSAAHAARMSAAMSRGHAMHAAMMGQPDGGNGSSCIADHGCGMKDAGACLAHCSCLLAYMPSSLDTPHRADPPVRHALPTVAMPTGNVPGLTERPPKLRLL
ncbi:MAG: hypothetical protein IE927_10135 [Rhodobacterales bacterium]|nr:hypothetical protein [Rhodobacterales bacterium]